MLQNASLLAIVALDTEENEPIKNEVWWVRRHFWGPRSAPEEGGDKVYAFSFSVSLSVSLFNVLTLSVITSILTILSGADAYDELYLGLRS